MVQLAFKSIIASDTCKMNLKKYMKTVSFLMFYFSMETVGGMLNRKRDTSNKNLHHVFHPDIFIFVLFVCLI